MDPPRRPQPGIHRAELFTPDECRAIVAAAEAHGGWQRARVLRRGRRVVRESRRRAEVLDVAGPRADPDLAQMLAPHLARMFELAREVDAAHFHTGIRASAPSSPRSSCATRRPATTRGTATPPIPASASSPPSAT